ncbi:heterokaryon incompatibility protein-domain-containing protein [Dendryphion nanum]|uniref:Heterokaryon incompatibility protein-domain-containing protein n=1 Tax=Dendryphion nanum TaxID=256645 RepID=A0A9P9E7F3_9PLEO|nr:heterokaryon incompatibility protein-domain-containing protein [Dendryphion nanum]
MSDQYKESGKGLSIRAKVGRSKKRSIRVLFGRSRKKALNSFVGPQQSKQDMKTPRPSQIGLESYPCIPEQDPHTAHSRSVPELSLSPYTTTQSAAVSGTPSTCFIETRIGLGGVITVYQLRECLSDNQCSFCDVLLHGLQAAGEGSGDDTIQMRWRPTELGGKTKTIALLVITKREIHAGRRECRKYELYRSINGEFYEKPFAQPLVNDMFSAASTPSATPTTYYNLLSRVTARPTVANDSNTRTCLSRVRSWLRHCLDEHEICGAVPALENIPKLAPRRIIDVGKEDGAPRLCDFASVYTENMSYVALSHCWGSHQTYKTEKNTLKSRIDGIDWEELPLTFRDAIKVTRFLGIRYIWIDSLCIIQDDMNDWAEESSKMCHVYTNAILTIAASGAQDDTVGFLGRREWLSNPIKIKGKDTGFAIRRSIHQDLAEYGPLMSRGWVFQERMLSRRVLYFEKYEIWWECRETRYCECGSNLFLAPYRVDPAIYNEIPDYPDFDRDSSSFGTYLFTQVGMDKDTYRWWREVVVTTYFPLGLTKPTDRLPALSGIASAVQNKTKDMYLAGLWSSDLAEGLLWQPGDENHKSVTLPTSYIAPSWSWASIHSTRIRFAPSMLFKPVFDLVGHKMTLSTVDPTGAVSDGELRIRCPFLEKVPCPTGSGDDPIVQVSGVSFRIYGIKFDTRLKKTKIITPDGSKWTLQRTNDTAGFGSICELGFVPSMILLGTGAYHLPTVYILEGLLVGLSTSKPGAYVRLGTFGAQNLDSTKRLYLSKPLSGGTDSPELERTFASHWKEITLV